MLVTGSSLLRFAKLLMLKSHDAIGMLLPRDRWHAESDMGKSGMPSATDRLAGNASIV